MRATPYQIVCLAVALCMAMTTAVNADSDRPLIVVHYMGWFGGEPTSPRWGWHWTMNRRDPDHLTDGVSDIASHYAPLIGPYDSADANVLEYQTLLMKTPGFRN